MKIDRIHENKLKVFLPAEEMQELSLEYPTMDSADAATRKALSRILEQARRQVQFDPHDRKIYIEIFPCEGGGCVIYLTCLQRGGYAGGEPVQFEFDDMASLLAGAAGAHRQYRQHIRRSMLYRMGERYRLILYPMDDADRFSMYFLGEYGRNIGEGALSAAYTEEHGQVVFPEDALRQLAEQFEAAAD